MKLPAVFIYIVLLLASFKELDGASFDISFFTELSKVKESDNITKGFFDELGQNVIEKYKGQLDVISTIFNKTK